MFNHEFNMFSHCYLRFHRSFSSKRQFTFPTGQHWLMKRMKNMGYSVNPQGLCHGIGYIGSEYFLQHLTPDEGLSELECDLNTIAEIPLSESSVEAPVETKANVYGIFDNIALTTDTRKYSYLFNKKTAIQDDEAVQSLYERGQQKRTLSLASFSGVYDHDELHNYFYLLNKYVSIPISLMLNSCNHRINVNYSDKTKQWYLIDANRLNFSPMKNIDELVSTLNNNFALQKPLSTTNIFGTTIKTRNDCFQRLVSQMRGLQSDSDWGMMHSMNTFKARQAQDHFGHTWLFSAVKQGDLTLCRQLLAQGADYEHLSKVGTSAVMYSCIPKEAHEMLWFFAANGANLHGIIYRNMDLPSLFASNNDLSLAFVCYFIISIKEKGFSTNNLSDVDDATIKSILLDSYFKVKYSLKKRYDSPMFHLNETKGDISKRWVDSLFSKESTLDELVEFIDEYSQQNNYALNTTFETLSGSRFCLNKVLAVRNMCHDQNSQDSHSFIPVIL